MKRVMIGLIRFYQKWISPLKPPCCRFTPSCSGYALEAFQKRGFFVGFALTVWRILRCNPFCLGGYNPVPEKGFDRYPVRVPKYANGQEHKAERIKKRELHPSETENGHSPSALEQDNPSADHLQAKEKRKTI